MVVSGPLARGTRCIGCQRQVLGAFLTGTLPQPGSRASRVNSPRPGQGSRRYAPVTGQRRYFASGVEHDDSSIKLNRDHGISERDASSQSRWYLEDGPDEIEEKPITERERLPQLPPNSPPILEPLLHHLSIDLGLDYLSLLDLRKLDPPPALGANLLMLFGTARSQKHLNVSADRCCRWLRSNYKLTPTADGLLGRNELKLKLRRKARRSRILSAAGASERTELDDGIVTGWICINLGSVENGPEGISSEDGLIDEEEAEGFVGFRTRSNQARVVVQMMTDEKRGEVDLESLWRGIIDRAARKELRDQEAMRDDAAETERTLSQGLRKASLPGTLTALTHPQRITGPAQIRRYSTSAREVQGNSKSTSARDEPIEGNSDEQRLPLDELIPALRSRTKPFFSKRDGRLRFWHDEVKRTYAPIASRQNHIPNWTDFESEEYESVYLETVFSPGRIDRLRATSTSGQPLDLDEAIATLSLEPEEPAAVSQVVVADSSPDSSAKPLIEPFWPALPDARHWEFAIALQCHFLRAGDPSYSKRGLFWMLLQMQLQCIWISEAMFHLALEALLLSPHILSAASMARLKLQRPEYFRVASLGASIGMAFDLLELMEAHSYDITTEHILLTLHNGITHPQIVAPPGYTIIQRVRGDKSRAFKSDSTSDPLSEATTGSASSGFFSANASSPSASPSASSESSSPIPIHPVKPFHHTALYKTNLHQYRRFLLNLYSPANPTPATHRPPTARFDVLVAAMLRSYVEMDLWSDFWDLWGTLPRLMHRRGEHLYALMFRGVAATGHVTHARRVVQEFADEMAREVPPVLMAKPSAAEASKEGLQRNAGAAAEGQNNYSRQIAEALRECLVVGQCDREKYPWRHWWAKVEAVLGKEKERPPWEQPEIKPSAQELSSIDDAATSAPGKVGRSKIKSERGEKDSSAVGNTAQVAV